MKHSKKILVILMALALCGTLAACGSSAGNTGGDSTQTESVAADSKEEKTPEAGSGTGTTGTAKTVNVGVILWSGGMADEAEFMEAVRTTLSEQYSDQIGEVVVKDSTMGSPDLHSILENYIAMWEGGKMVFLIINDENGFSDEELLSASLDAEKANAIMGVDHIIEGAPGNTFVYDPSDAAGCVSMIIENAFK